jgi:ketosteroid isomerase-like protein
MDAPTQTELIGVLERFCSGFANRDTEAVMSVFGPDPDLVVVTSEKELLRGPAQLKDFLNRYADGATTYTWNWHRHDVGSAGSVAWLLAEGTETALTDGRSEKHAYRMTMVLVRHEDRWVLVQVHGSSPH